MKSPWQYVSLFTCIAPCLDERSVYNLKRRMASLSPITLETFESKIQTPAEPPQVTPEPHPIEATDHESVSPKQCLFCHLTFDDETEELNEVVEHMYVDHGLFIPDRALLSDQASFLGYLATQIRVWHECLYCGVTRTSTSAIQSHMKDSGHCMLNFSKEPELCEFWERRSDREDDATNVGIKSTNGVEEELRLPSGKTVGSKSFRRPKPQATRPAKVRLALPARSESSQSQEPSMPQSCCQLARRNEIGIQNISFQQRHALVLAVKRSQKDEAMAKRAKEWTYARKGNDQKHDQNYGALAWAKGGMHNLLPR